MDGLNDPDPEPLTPGDNFLAVVIIMAIIMLLRIQ
jgi:hypothetical protein